jgi:VWFA-related protein
MNNKKGDRCEFATAHNIFLGLERKQEIPKGTLIRATVAKIERRKRPFRAPVVNFDFNELLGPQGGSIPLKLRIVRAIGGALREGPDLLLRQDFVLETELVEDLLIPLDSPLLQPWNPPVLTGDSSRSTRDIQTNDPTNIRDHDSRFNPEPVRTSLPRTPAPGNLSTAFKLTVDVDLIQLQAVVRNRKGEFLQGLQQADFTVLEDGVEQTLRQISQDTTPLAVALVVDSSDSIEPYLEELQEAARTTLQQLSPGDQVALFTFSETLNRLEDLTKNYDRIAEHIPAIQPLGLTNIYDALFDASYYLSRQAPNRRHVIILLSDNRATALDRNGEGSAIRMVLQTETVVYNLKLPSPPPPPRQKIYELPVWIGSYDLVNRISFQSGGEVIEVNRKGSLSSSLDKILTQVKHRNSLVYVSNNTGHEGSFRRIAIHLAPKFGRPGRDYTVHARRGYYHSATKSDSEGDNH